jgi:phage tail tape-measure protein
MAKCPKCQSTELEISQSVVVGSTGIGAQVGSIIGGALTIATGPLMILGLLAGAALGGWGGNAAGEAIDPRWKWVCGNCGYSWKQSEEP